MEAIEAGKPYGDHSNSKALACTALNFATATTKVYDGVAFRGQPWPVDSS
jgi:hypothetical protein